MPTASTYVLSLSLLILIAIQECCGEKQSSICRHEATMVIAMKQVSQALQCFGNTSQESLRTIQEGIKLQKQNTNVLNSLPDTMRKIIEEIHSQIESENEKICRHDATMVTTMKQVSEALQCFRNTSQESLRTIQEGINLQKQNTNVLNSLPDTMRNIIEEIHSQNESENEKVKRLSQEVMDLKNELGNKNQMLDSLSQEVLDLKSVLDEKNEHVTALTEDVKDCKNQLQTKEKEVDALNDAILEQKKVLASKNISAGTQKPVDWTKNCKQIQHLEMIKPLVLAYIENRDWSMLKNGIKAVLDHKSDEYGQLQWASSLNMVGNRGYVQLASLLLCAGLPVDSADSDRGNMLHGAAYGDHIHVARLLLDHGANINARGYHDNTPLIFAAFYNHWSMVKFLVQAGADTSAKDMYGLTSLSWAKKLGNTAVAQYLELFPN